MPIDMNLRVYGMYGCILELSLKLVLLQFKATLQNTDHVFHSWVVFYGISLLADILYD